VGSANGYRHVGLAVLAGGAGPEPDVITVTSVQVLALWLGGRSPDALGSPPPSWSASTVACGWRLGAVNVDCAIGQQVLAVGQVLVARDGAGWAVREISNQSAGYGPDLDSRLTVAIALDRLGLARTPAISRTRSSSAAARNAAS
jgi:hypothetical protein